MIIHHYLYQNILLFGIFFFSLSRLFFNEFFLSEPSLSPRFAVSSGSIILLPVLTISFARPAISLSALARARYHDTHRL